MATIQDAYKLLHDGAVALSRVEHNGIRIDVDYLDNTIKQTGERIAQLQESLRQDELYKTWRKVFRDETKLGSREQLSEILFNVMGYEVPGHTETGRIKADVAALSTVDHPFVRDYIKLEKLKKAKGTFLKGIADEVCNGYLHPSFNLNTVVTFRSCVAKGTLVKVFTELPCTCDKVKNVPIEQVKVGDYVYCYDDKLQLTTRKVLWSGKTGRRKVLRLHWEFGDNIATGHVDITPEHKVRLKNGKYVELQDVDFDDYDGNCLVAGREITRISEVEQAVDVYDLEVEELNNFIANEICVHNSSSNPNFQNLPMRDPEFAEIIRKCFIPRKGNVLVEIDYSGIEVRISACYNKDPNLIKYINDPTTDMHRDTAMDLFFLKQDQVEKRTTRDWAKNRFVFPQFYGSVYFQCAPHLWEAASQDQYKLPGTDITIRQHLKENGVKKLGDCVPNETPKSGTFEAHVKKVEDSFWNKRFRVYSEWKKTWYNNYRRNGGFVMLTGFPVKGLFTRNDVINYPVQGSAFHCLLQSLCWIQDYITKKKMRTKLVGQIHDSIIADVPVSELQDYLNLAKRTMTQRLMKAWKWIIVPLEIEADVTPEGSSWFDKKPWIEKDGIWVAKS